MLMNLPYTRYKIFPIKLDKQTDCPLVELIRFCWVTTIKYTATIKIAIKRLGKKCRKKNTVFIMLFIFPCQC